MFAITGSQGKLGEVHGRGHKACDTRLDRFVALKMLRLQRTADLDLERKRRFVQEAKAASVCGSQKVISMAR